MSRVPCWRLLILLIVMTVTVSVWIRTLHCTKVWLSIYIGPPPSLERTRPSREDGYAVLALWSTHTTRHTAREFPHPQLSAGSISPTMLPFSFFIPRKRIYFGIHECCIPLTIREPLINKQDRWSCLKRLTILNCIRKIPAPYTGRKDD